MRYLIIALFVFLSGCMSRQFYQDSARAWLACQGTQCDTLMAKAENWLKWKKYVVTQSSPQVIKTAAPSSRDPDLASITVAREQNKDGTPVIAIYGETYSNLMGAYYYPAGVVNELYYYLQGEKK